MINELEQREALQVEESRTTAAVSQMSQEGGEGAADADELRALFKAEYDDYIECVVVHGQPGSTTEGATTHKARKPYHLMRSTYEPDADLTYVDVNTRKYKSGDPLEETQDITPKYVVDQEITIVRGRIGGNWAKVSGVWTNLNYREDNGEHNRGWGKTC